MSLIRHIRAMMTFARHQPWVDQPEWTVEDARTLTSYMASKSGQRLKATLLNMNLRQQASILGKQDGLKFEVGYATGQAAAIAAITSLADVTVFTEDGENDADQPAN